MNYKQSDLDLMKRDVDEFGVEALLTPEALKLLIADLEEARKERSRYLDTLVSRHGGEPIALLSELDEAREEIAELRAAMGSAK